MTHPGGIEKTLSVIAAKRSGLWGVLFLSDDVERMFVPCDLVSAMMMEIDKAHSVACGIHASQVPA